MTQSKNTLPLMLAVAVLILGVCSPAFAVPVIDGIVSSSDGYDVSYRLDFYSDNTLVANGGEIYMYQERGVDSSHPDYLDTYVAFIVPIALNDNLYGEVNNKNDKHPTPDGYASWDYGGHDYGDLIESDQATFTAYDEMDNLVFDFIMPYFGDIPISPVAPVSQWNTSLNYNLANYSNPDNLDLHQDSPFPQESPTSSIHVENGWYFNMIYEFKVEGTAYQDPQGNFNDLNIVVIGESHNSPVKLDKDAYPGDVKKTLPVIEGSTPSTPGSSEYVYAPSANPNPAPVPEPSTIFLLGSGILGVSLLGRGKNSGG